MKRVVDVKSEVSDGSNVERRHREPAENQPTGHRSRRYVYPMRVPFQWNVSPVHRDMEGVSPLYYRDPRDWLDHLAIPHYGSPPPITETLDQSVRCCREILKCLRPVASAQSFQPEYRFAPSLRSLSRSLPSFFELLYAGTQLVTSAAGYLLEPSSREIPSAPPRRRRRRRLPLDEQERQRLLRKEQLRSVLPAKADLPRLFSEFRALSAALRTLKDLPPSELPTHAPWMTGSRPPIAPSASDALRKIIDLYAPAMVHAVALYTDVYLYDYIFADRGNRGSMDWELRPAYRLWITEEARLSLASAFLRAGNFGPRAWVGLYDAMRRGSLPILF